MNKEIRLLAPAEIWSNFADLNAVPRPSKKEERVIEFIMNFGKKLQLETIRDTVGNVIIRKPATPGMENRKKVVLQSHLDMVHQKNADTEFDFENQGIEMYVEKGWVKAKGTTLGADNGLGVATIMAVLESNDLPHPAIEALFTIDEETGMTGAMHLEGGLLEGEILLNLDTEEDDEIDIGCAGGVDITAIRTYREEEVPEGTIAYAITVKGLRGGHSGMDIHLGLGNANKIMNRLLFEGFEQFGLRIAQIDGGGLRNAIPRESFAVVVVDTPQKDAFVYEFTELAEIIKKELASTEPSLAIEVKETNAPKAIMELGVQEGLTRALYAALNGVYAMSATMDGLVETSNNIARVYADSGKIQVSCLTRSSVESAKADLANSLRAAFELAGFEVTYSGDYPGWTPNIKSPILQVLKQKYVQLFESEPRVVACHAGLECGILGQHYPEMDMISFGPNIKGAHSPDERAEIASVEKFWTFTKAILESIPEK
ncbi:aminoacyl-histidine dipeptidase [Ascidiimonas aurantiaca]|uniref:aminoacyl-histidine dipeptidase n=1 Tax=Ascidiimonas aurantiaca TaxID=1685432 RepID=UPI0030ED7803